MGPRDAVFIDTSGWVALLNRGDYLHALAIEAAKRIKLEQRRLITSDWVVAETGNGLARTQFRRRFVERMREFRTLPIAAASLFCVDDVVCERAMELYHRVDDKGWGLVDCASFVIMRELDITDALTSDQHFEQAGFRCLLSTVN
jgi:predicted nucleic acid-binding protein